MARSETKTKRDPTDITDEKWARLVPFMPKAARRGRKAAEDLREVLNALRYIGRAGCGRRMMPKDFPPRQTRARRARGEPRCWRLRQPDDQGPACGYDAGNKIVGRKRHITVDIDGRLITINLTTADIRTAPARR